jgi:hypothetical protein
MAMGGAGVDECPECGSDQVGVTDTRPEANGRRRRKKCDACGHRWTTLEMHMGAAKEALAGSLALRRADRLLADAAGHIQSVRSRLAGAEAASDVEDAAA